MGVKAFPVEGGEGPSLETKRCSRGRFLVLLVAIYGLRRLNVGQRHFQEPSHHYSPPPGHLLRLPVYTLGPFSHVRDPPFVSGTIHTVSHRSPLSLSLFYRPNRAIYEHRICVRKVLAMFRFWRLILSNFEWILKLMDATYGYLHVITLLDRLNRLFIFVLIWRNRSVSLMT